MPSRDVPPKNAGETFMTARRILSFVPTEVCIIGNLFKGDIAYTLSGQVHINGPLYPLADGNARERVFKQVIEKTKSLPW